MFKKSQFVLLVILVMACKEKTSEYLFNSETLIIKQISDHTYQHITYLQTNDFGKVGCNGMIVVDNSEAIIFDTPADDETSIELIEWVENELKSKVIAVIPTHFHRDCLGGLKAFHTRQIQSIAHNKTIQLLDSTAALPWSGFDDFIYLTVGKQEVIVDFAGEGHTADNVIAYFPTEQVMFGGCLVKKLNAGKGNLEDANLKEWSNTIEKIKAKYPDTKWVIPGHGPAGDQTLLNYTSEMFRPGLQ